jgi:hypothetical protein
MVAGPCTTPAGTASHPEAALSGRSGRSVMWKVTHTVGEHLCDVVPGPPTGRVWQPPWKGIAAGEKRARPALVFSEAPSLDEEEE